jgi:uncharacterized protein
MKIGVLSDSHGDVFYIERAIEVLKGCNIIYHLGDYVRDCDIIRMKLRIPIVSIRGNCDLPTEGISEVVDEKEGINIFLTHGHNYAVKHNNFKLRYKAMETNSKVVLYGHTHIAKIEKEEEIYYINPGSISEPRNGSTSSVAIIQISNGIVSPKIVKL